jgi:cytochrome c-type biogenesis protein
MRKQTARQLMRQERRREGELRREEVRQRAARRKRITTVGIIGVIFAVGWTPCISLVLCSVLGLAATAATLQQGVLLPLFYSLGMGLPFRLLGLDQSSRVSKWLGPRLGKIEVSTGAVMILVGVMIYFNWLVYLNRYFSPFVRL